MIKISDMKIPVDYTDKDLYEITAKELRTDIKRIRKIEVFKIEDKIHSVGIDLALAESLINFLNNCFDEEIDVNNVDISNLVLVLKRMIKNIRLKHDKIETILNI